MRDNSKWTDILEDLLGEDFVLTEAALQTVIDDELQKDDDQMDMEFIDYCTDLLLDMQDGKLVSLTGEIAGNQSSEAEPAPSNIVSEAESENSTAPVAPLKEVKKKKRRRIGRTLLIAAILTALLSCTLLASANKEGYTLNSDLASFVGKYLKIDLSEGKVTPDKYTDIDSALIQELNNNGFTDIVLPKALVDGDWAVSEITYDRQELLEIANIKIYSESLKAVGSIAIIKYENHMPTKKGYSQVKNATQFEVNGLDVTVVHHSNNKTDIMYSDVEALTSYTIIIPGDLDRAIEIAQTL